MRSFKSKLCCILLNIVTMLGLLCLFRITENLYIPPVSAEEVSTSSSITVEQTTSEQIEETTTPTQESVSAPTEEELLQERLSNILFIGDSRTEGLYKFTKAGEYSDFCCKPGYNISTIREQTVASYPNQSLMDTIRQRNYQTIYICLGYNELGWKSVEKFVDDYQTFILEIQEMAPETELCVIGILNVCETFDDILEPYENNQRIAEFNTEIQTMCQENQLSFLDLNPDFVDETGNLPQDSTEDGIHFTAEFCKKYLDTLLQ